MGACNQTKVGEVYTCEKCGWEFEVKKECSCGCKQSDTFCCGQPMTVRTAEQETD